MSEPRHRWRFKIEDEARRTCYLKADGQWTYDGSPAFIGTSTEAAAEMARRAALYESHAYAVVCGTYEARGVVEPGKAVEA